MASQRSEGVAPSDAELEAKFYWVPWRAPFWILGEEIRGCKCRYCLAAVGTRAQLFGSESEFQEHLDVFHS